MLCKGEDGNYNEPNLRAYLERLKEVKPEEVHLYSLLYAPFPQFEIYPVSREEMNDLAKNIQESTSAKVLVFVDPVEEWERFRF